MPLRPCNGYKQGVWQGFAGRVVFPIHDFEVVLTKAAAMVNEARGV